MCGQLNCFNTKLNLTSLMLIHKIATLALALALATSASAQKAFGYTDLSYERNDGVTLSTTASHGQAICLPKEKLQSLKGAKITAIKTAVSTRQLIDTKIFVTKELDSTPLSVNAASGLSTRVQEFKLTTPVVIDGESDLYVGYTTQTEVAGYRPCLFDRSADLPAGLSWCYGDKGWTDMAKRGYGAPILQAVIEDAPASLTDLIVKPVEIKGYHVTGKVYDYAVQVFNFGTTPVTAFDLSYQIGENETVETIPVNNLTLAAGKYTTITIKDVPSTNSGNLNLNIEAKNVNGSATADMDNTDNAQSTSFYIYPQSVVKKVLFEEFTGQACSNCPAGYQAIKKTLEGYPNHVIVAHHSGYQPDMFSMNEDWEYTFFYNADQIYAPAAMVDRVPYAEGASTPVFGQSGMNASTISNAVDNNYDNEPYVAIRLDNTFDADTRSGIITVYVDTHVLPDTVNLRLNVWLTQDGIEGYQAGTSGFVHNHAFRGSLTDVWGVPFTLKLGKTTSKSFEYNIPEEIISTYTNAKVKAVPENMHLVAFVSKISSSAIEHRVYNAETTKMTTTTTGIENLPAATTPKLLLNGRSLSLSTPGHASVLTPAGVHVASLSASETVTLTPGIYLVQVNGNKANRILVK